MSVGSKKSWEGHLLVRAKETEGTILRILLGAMLLSGCHHAGWRTEPASENELPTLSSEELFEVAQFQARRGDLLRAEQYLTAARSAGYEQATVAYWLVRICVSAGRYHSALGHARDYLRDHPDNWSLRLVVASIHEALGDLKRAELELERIIRAQPARPLPRYRLGMLYRQATLDSPRAVSQLQTYLYLAPDGPHAAEVRTVLDEVEHLRVRSRSDVPGVLGGDMR